jgi:hypothetical protein
MSDSGKKHSKSGMSKAMARKQMAALNMSLAREKVPALKSSRSYPRKKSTTIGIMSAEDINRNVIIKEAAAANLKKLAEPPSLKDHLDDMRKERKEMGSSMIKLAPESVELESFAPKKIEMPLERDVDYKDMSTAQRKKLYIKYHEDGMKPEDVPKEARKGYKTWIKRNI